MKFYNGFSDYQEKITFISRKSAIILIILININNKVTLSHLHIHIHAHMHLHTHTHTARLGSPTLPRCSRGAGVTL